MVAPAIPADMEWTVADLLDRFGPIVCRRIRHDPPPGTATEQDVVDIHNHEGLLFELVDGVLVEKTMGIQESYLAVVIASLIREFVERGDLGIVLGADGMARLAPGLVRIPDVSYVNWDRFPGRKVPAAPMLNLAPNLAVEVLSPYNTKREMERKLIEYFDAGVVLVWYIDPRARTATAYSSPNDGIHLDASQSLEGGTVLPGLSIALHELFAKLEPPA